MKKKQFIIYEGPEYTLEWYWNENSKSPAREYFNELDNEQKLKAYKLFETMGAQGKIFNKEKFNYEEDKIYAFKPKPDRFLCFFFEGSKIIITNGFEKKSDKLPKNEKEKAVRYKNDYLKRVKGGSYYD